MFQPCPTRPFLPARHGVGLACVAFVATTALATRTQEGANPTLQEVVISASRAEQRRFNAPGAIEAVQVDPFRTAFPLVNLSELMGSVSVRPARLDLLARLAGDCQRSHQPGALQC